MIALVWILISVASAQQKLNPVLPEDVQPQIESSENPAPPTWIKDIRRRVYAEPLGSMVRTIFDNP